MNKEVYFRKNCRACSCEDFELIFSLNDTPIGDAYVNKEKSSIVQKLYPIELYLCKNCGLAQILHVINPEILYSEYIYETLSSPGLNNHFKNYSESVIKRFKLPLGSKILDVGCNDATLLSHFKSSGMQVLGIEPAKLISSKNNENGINCISDFFNQQVANEILKKYGKFNIITANNVFANIDDLNEWIKCISILLDFNGVFIFESFYLADLVKNMVFDFIYHEHLSAFSVRPIEVLFLSNGMQLFAVEQINTKGGSLRYYVQFKNGGFNKDGSVDKYLQLEKDVDLYSIKTYKEFSNKINDLKYRTKSYLNQSIELGKKIVGYGASITCTTLIYHFEIGNYISYIVDDSKAKQGLYSPGLHIPVFERFQLSIDKPDIVVILAWRFTDQIISQNKDFLNSGGCFIIPVPEFKIISL